MINPIGWFEIYVQDLERARVFYEQLFSISLSELAGAPLAMLAFPSSMEEYGAGGALVHVEGMPSGGNSVLVYFHSENCAVEAQRVAGLGGELVRDKMSIGEYGHIVLARDTEGNLIGIHSMQ